MAYQIIRGDREGKEFEITAICDTASELTNLGTNFAPGSVAYVPGSSVYVLNASGNWVEEA